MIVPTNNKKQKIRNYPNIYYQSNILIYASHEKVNVFNIFFLLKFVKLAEKITFAPSSNNINDYNTNRIC